ncbi:MAG TPA: HepT-like ribonuclease domain-containing protein [Actinokineospora sp.]|nr:HepT-like ribonuclease domain-containing protein [Actinokineospora sp.]
MTKRRRTDVQHLDDAVEHLRVLQEHLTRGSLDDALVRDAVSHRLEVAIDAVGRVDNDLIQVEAPADWPKIVGMRNMIAHQYADFDTEILQNTIDNRLAGFIELVDRLRSAAIAAERT